MAKTFHSNGPRYDSFIMIKADFQLIYTDTDACNLPRKNCIVTRLKETVIWKFAQVPTIRKHDKFTTLTLIVIY